MTESHLWGVQEGLFRLLALAHHEGKSGQGIKAETWRQELTQGPWRDVLTDLLSLLPYTALNQPLRGSTTHRRPGAPTSVMN